MIGRTSLVEQKKLQWAKEREETARLSGNWGPLKFTDPIRTAIRTRMCMTELNGKEQRHYGSTVSLRSLASENSATCAPSLKSLDFSGGSLINLQDKTEIHQALRRRSPSLPPIYSNKDQQQYLIQEQRALGVDGLRYPPRRSNGHHDNQSDSCHPYEEREGETSGYASDSVEATVTSLPDPLMSCKPSENNTNEKTWQNPYYTNENALPSSRRLSNIRGGEFNRPRWESIWGQNPSKGDPPPPSWLERGLSRLDHSTQVLVINHDSASSPDSSTTGSTGSDSNKTYLRGQNLPIDADVLLEREARRQKAVELQNAIKQQLEEREKHRREERERKIREEREEEERLKRERDKEKERLEEEHRRQKEKEAAKEKKAEAMREVIEAAERLSKEEKKLRRKRDINENNDPIPDQKICKPSSKVSFPDEASSNPQETKNSINSINSINISNSMNTPIEKEAKQVNNQREIDFKIKETNTEKECLGEPFRESFKESKESNSIRVPVSKDVAIVLSGRLEDTELLNKANLQVVNLVMTPSPRKNEVNHLMSELTALVNSLGAPGYSSSRAKISPRIAENRLLTPSKYRYQNSRECGTQTDTEKEFQDLQDRIQELGINKNFVKERKDAANNNRRDVEKSTCTSTVEETAVKTLPRMKTQPRMSLETRPRWNANRPGTRYRTQSEKDPHYQHRMRLRRRRLESSDEGSRSPSPDRRKHNISKQKTRNSSRRKAKLDSYDADLSMDSLNSIIPLRFDEHGRINIEDRRNEHEINKYNVSSSYEPNFKDVDSKMWCGQEILSHLSSLRNGLVTMKEQWDPQKCPVSPITELY